MDGPYMLILLPLIFLCLIHNPHSGKILTYWKIAYIKNKSREKFWVIFLFKICHSNLGLVFNNKNYYITSKNYLYFIRKFFQNLCLKFKRDLWMRRHVPHLRKILFFPKFWTRKLQTKRIFCTIILFNICHSIQAWYSNIKPIISQNNVYFTIENFKNMLIT
jgi:hypothetical protein